jgi:hypothetical protein
LRPVVEALMYLAFFAAALPMAWLGVSEVIYYQAHPDMLEVRDSALIVPAVVWAVGLMKPALASASVMALYFLVAGPREVRINSAVLILAWVATFGLAFTFVTPTAFASMTRLYWDAIPFVALALLPWLCAGMRLASRRRNERPAA